MESVMHPLADHSEMYKLRPWRLPLAKGQIHNKPLLNSETGQMKLIRNRVGGPDDVINKKIIGHTNYGGIRRATSGNPNPSKYFQPVHIFPRA
jgi:hypothetical protein